MFNGIVSSNGDAVLCFRPADLQDPPELLPEFVQRWEAGYEVVYGIRAKREESRVLVAIRSPYYRVVNRFAGISSPKTLASSNSWTGLWSRPYGTMMTIIRTFGE